MQPVLQPTGNNPDHPRMPTFTRGDDDVFFRVPCKRPFGLRKRFFKNGSLDRLAFIIEGMETLRQGNGFFAVFSGQELRCEPRIQSGRLRSDVGQA